MRNLYTHSVCIFSGVIDYLTAEISTSKQKKFSLVTFVDTPGLVDGDMIYPFDVNSAITWLGTSSQVVAPVLMDDALKHLCFSNEYSFRLQENRLT